MRLIFSLMVALALFSVTVGCSSDGPPGSDVPVSDEDPGGGGDPGPADPDDV